MSDKATSNVKPRPNVTIGTDRRRPAPDVNPAPDQAPDGTQDGAQGGAQGGTPERAPVIADATPQPVNVQPVNAQPVNRQDLRKARRGGMTIDPQDIKDVLGEQPVTPSPEDVPRTRGLQRAEAVRESDDSIAKGPISDGSDQQELDGPVNGNPDISRKPVRVNRARGGRLDPKQVVWGNNVALALGLPVPSSQRRLADEGAATAKQIAESTTHDDIDKKAAEQHAGVLTAAGDPPWDATVAMRATAAKVQLDLLSMPPNDRKLKPLNADLKSVNATFWIENSGADGSSKAFLCKPVTKRKVEAMPSGGPPGGEVAREALAGRAAQFLHGKGLDIGMPETHVVKLRPDLIPGETGTGDVTCSVQQFGASDGQIGNQSRAARAKVDPEQVAALGMFDMLTLANDRHPGNVLLNAEGKLVPIDHGENFSETKSPDALARMKITLGGSANALLSLPSAHEPMPDKVAATAKAIIPGDFGDTLRGDRKAIAAEHPEMDGMISDDAIQSAERSAEFMKRAARRKPPLSIAAVQVALGSHAKELLDPALAYGEFSKNADKCLDVAAKQQGAVKEVCLTSNTDYELLCREVEKLGFHAARRGEPTESDLLGDPMGMIAVLKAGQKALPRKPVINYPPDLLLPDGAGEDDDPDLKQRRRNFAKEYSARYAIARIRQVEDGRDAVTEEDAGGILLKTRKAAVDALMALLPPTAAKAAQKRRDELDAGQLPPKDLVAAYRDLSNDLTDAALQEQKARFQAVEQKFRWDKFSQHEEFNLVVTPGAYLYCFNELTAANVLKAEEQLLRLEASDLTDDKVAEALWKKFDAWAKSITIDSKDAGLNSFIAALKQKDVDTGLTTYLALKTRATSGEFG